jgi:glycosyltransferase involved in cell wall biosynthesis
VAAPDACRRGLHGHVWEQLWLPAAVNGHLLWSPANTGPLAVRRQVVTIHDISPIEHPEWFTPRFAAWYQYLLPRLARQARRVITVSAFTRGRIIERMDIPEAKVIAIPHGVSPEFQPLPVARIEATRSAYGLTSPYLLAVGSLQPRKNLHRLLRVWRQLDVRAPISLVIVGSHGPGFRDIRLDAASGNLRLLAGVPDADLPALYAGALGFVQPSLYEGFGLPVLEAMACGAPVVMSGTSALPEVGGGVALSMDPYDERSMREAIQRLVEDDRWRERASEMGRARSSQFTWERTADLTWNVLCEAAEDHP